MAEELKVLQDKVTTLEEGIRKVHTNMEDSVKEAAEKAMISIKTDNNQKIEEEVARRMQALENNLEDSIAMKVKEAAEKAIISIKSDNNQKIEEEVARRMQVLENNSTRADVPDPKKPFKCPKCVWRGKIQAAVKGHMTKMHHK